MRKKFIALEGIDGVGKSTVSKALAVALNKRGIPAVFFNDHPANTSLLRKEEKEWAHTEASVEESFRLFLASAEHKAGIVEGLLQTTWVVADRHVDSVYAHHLAHGLDFRHVRAHAGSIDADHVVHVTLPEDVRLARLKKRKETTSEDLEPAHDDSTLLGRKRLWFGKLIDFEVPNTGTLEDAIARIMSVVLREN